MKVAIAQNKEFECSIHTISDFSLDLGNNFNYETLMREVYKNKSLVEYIESHVSLADDVTFECTGLYGNIKEETCMSDIHDHFASYEREEIAMSLSDCITFPTDENIVCEADIPWR